MAERAIRIEADGVRLYAILHDTPAATRLWEALPIAATARVARGEVAFDVDLEGPSDGGAAGAPTKPGDLLYRRGQRTVALLYQPGGQDPAASGSAAPHPDPATLVCGRITGDASRLARVAPGARVKVTALGD